VVPVATYGWYLAADVLAAAGAGLHLAPLGVKGFTYRRVKNDVHNRLITNLTGHALSGMTGTVFAHLYGIDLTQVTQALERIEDAD
jgi:hypothetical protein